MKDFIKKRLHESLDKTITCEKCGWNWKKSESGPDMYFCHKCGRDNTPNNINETITKKQVMDVPKYLYHATFKPLLYKIKLGGLGGVSAKQLWDDSMKGVVYLALDAHVAFSYAENAFDENEDIPESWGEKIIVLVIDTDKLDKSKLYIDRNVIDNEGDTVEYHGVIPFDAIVDIMTEDDL